MQGALSNIRVLDLTRGLTGPFATKLLADYGADVVKVEPPGGEPGRRLAPFMGDDPHPEKSGVFFMLNTNKRGITLDITTASGQAILRQLATRADIVIESLAPGFLAANGVGYEELRALKPEIVMLSVSNFGQTGPYRSWKGSEAVLYGMGGEMHSTGLAGREPLKMGGTVAQFLAGATAAIAAMAGLTAKRVHGTGQWIDFSIYEALASSPDRRTQLMMVYQFSGLLEKRPSEPAHFMSGTFPCKDGFVEFWCDVPRWPKLKRLLGDPPELGDVAWAKQAADGDEENRATFDRVFLPWLAARTMREAWHESQAAGLLCAPCFTTADLYADEYYRDRGFWQQVEHRVMGTVTMPGRPFIMSESPWALRRPAPLLGEHTVEVLGELGYGAGDVVSLREAGVI